MTVGLADTTIFIARESGRPLDEAAVPNNLRVSVVTIGELRVGVLVAVDGKARDARLTTLTEALAFKPIPVDDGVVKEWATLRLRLRESGQRMPVNDSWIAATAMALGIPVVTQDADYVTVDGLAVIRV